LTELVNAPTIVDDLRNTGGVEGHGIARDRAWEDANSEKRREEFATYARLRADDLRAARKQQALGTRVDRCTTRLARLSNLPARQIGEGRTTTEDSAGGRRPAGEVKADIEREHRILIAAVEALERALDVEEGLAPEGAAHLMATNAKDRELLTLHAGLPSSVVAENHPEQGVARTVRRRRAAAGLDPRGLDPVTGLAPSPARVDAAVVLLSREGRLAA
jgi:hypothetical protein